MLFGSFVLLLSQTGLAPDPFDTGAEQPIVQAAPAFANNVFGSQGMQEGQILDAEDFVQTSVQGFGDRQNTWAWSMQWWNGHLYVGTNRSWGCVRYAAWLPDLYPPSDPDIQCTPEPEDLLLQAEIWRYAPETDIWERVYQSPNDVEIPESPEKYTARDFGFRGMTVFTESDGTEALYVAGVSTRPIHPDVPPPRLLRSADGVNFEAVPQDPGTVLGDLEAEGFRSLTTYRGRLYATAGNLFGDGVLLESGNPAGGNDNFRQVTPDGMRVFEMVPFNGYLYLGLQDTENGYAVVKTDASGMPPYTFTPVVADGGFLSEPSKTVLSMYVFQDHLYVGTDRPAELTRIDSNDGWELVVGAPRETPEGRKEPLSGMRAGFGFAFNGHMWRMASYNGWLYVGTADFSTALRDIPVLGEVLRPRMGFDLYATPNGQDFVPVTSTGFDDIFDFGLRTIESTPYGLFLGSANSYYGTKIWQGRFRDDYSIYLPIVRS